MQNFYAHSTADSSRENWQLLAEHLHGVAKQARQNADVFGHGQLAEVQGLLHDIGKYTEAFQQRLHGSQKRVDHSTHGAQIIASKQYGPIGMLLAYGIAGHHAGLANGQGEGSRLSLQDRLQTDLPELDPAWQREISIPVELQKVTLETYKPQAKARFNFQLAFFTRLLFSCLVDADFIDTERFYRRIDKQPNYRDQDSTTPTLLALRQQLDTHLQSFQANRDANSDVNRLRAEILAHTRQQAIQPPGLFSLTVPTGGGKTLASLAFALDHAITHGLRRIIFVIPFTSIVEQNAAVFRQALGSLGERAVLEHHSAFVQTEVPRDDPDRYQSEQKLKLAMENWDAPIIVTTAVQFFESLFAAKPSQCRKLHNIAASVVVLDEAQTMPLHLLRPCVAAIDELARNYRSSVVLCTATQPVLEAPAFDGGLEPEKVRELAPAPAQLFRQLERVQVRHIGVLDDDALTAHMRSREQVLCIVNNRRHARAIYLATKDMPGARHLTTLMCAKHRSAVLAEVRKMLKAGKPCRLVSTSLIEAGVDVDFPTVLRAEAGLDSIAQAAGRCNREGRRSAAASEVLIFANASKDWAAPPELQQYADVANEVLRHLDGSPLSPEAIEHYFSLLYWKKGNELDKHGLMSLLQACRPESLPMETLATKFRMIESVQVPIIIPYDDEARKALRDLEFAEGCGALARKLQPYLVQLPKQGFEALRKAGAVVPVKADRWGDQFMMLAHEGLYDQHYGLSWDDPTYIRTEHLIC